jgi:protein-arginine kinase activator protein McsA
MICEDCTKRESTTLIYDRIKDGFFAICDKCLKPDDKIIPDRLIKRFLEE